MNASLSESANYGKAIVGVFFVPLFEKVSENYEQLIGKELKSKLSLVSPSHEFKLRAHTKEVLLREMMGLGDLEALLNYLAITKQDQWLNLLIEVAIRDCQECLDKQQTSFKHFIKQSKQQQKLQADSEVFGIRWVIRKLFSSEEHWLIQDEPKSI